MNELKPCPFCGSDQLSLQHEENGWYSVACLNPECCINGPWDMGKSGTIEAWNTRPLEAKLLEACKRLVNPPKIPIADCPADAGTFFPCECGFHDAIEQARAAIAAAEGEQP